MSEFIIHTVPGSPFARAVLMALEEKGAPYRVSAVMPGTLQAPEHLKRHPFGRIPVLEHGDFSLYETQAILRYIDRVVTPGSLTPPDPKAAGRMDQIMNVNDWYLFQGVANIIAFQRVVGPRLMGLEPDLKAIETAMPRAKAVFTELARLLGTQTFFAGQAVSLADLLLFPQLDFMREAPEWATLAGPYPTLEAWMDRMAARPSAAATTWEKVAAMAR